MSTYQERYPNSCEHGWGDIMLCPQCNHSCPKCGYNKARERKRND